MIMRIRRALYEKGFRPKKTSFWYNRSYDLIYTRWFSSVQG